MQKFEVGDLCVTQHTTAGLLNNGMAVLILDTCPSRFDDTTLYLIRRIDGKSIPATLAPVTGLPSFFSSGIAWAAEHKLRRADPVEVISFREATARLTEPA